MAITSHLAISNAAQMSGDDIDALTDRLLSGERITVGSQAAAVDILDRIGLSEPEVADRLRHDGL